MLKKIGIAPILLLFSATLALAAVSEEKINAAKTGGSTVEAANGTGGGLAFRVFPLQSHRVRPTGTPKK